MIIGIILACILLSVWFIYMLNKKLKKRKILFILEEFALDFFKNRRNTVIGYSNNTNALILAEEINDLYVCKYSFFAEEYVQIKVKKRIDDEANLILDVYYRQLYSYNNPNKVYSFPYVEYNSDKYPIIKYLYNLTRMTSYGECKESVYS